MIKVSNISAVLCSSIIIFIETSFCQSNWVDGTLIEFNNNSAWSWFQDERAVVDTVKQKLIIGSAAHGGPVDVVIYDINQRNVESKTTIGNLSSDDHNTPGLLIQLGSGDYIAMFCDHYDKYNSRYSIYNGQSWSSEKRFDWTTIPGGTDYTIAYSNLYYLSSDNYSTRALIKYVFTKNNNRSPSLLFISKSWI